MDVTKFGYNEHSGILKIAPMSARHKSGISLPRLSRPCVCTLHHHIHPTEYPLSAGFFFNGAAGKSSELSYQRILY